MSESALMREIMLAVSKTGARVFRNNTGTGWVGHRHPCSGPHMVSLSNPRPLHAGLCVGSSDLIGWTVNGRFLAIEVKTAKGRTVQEQVAFISAVRHAGGVAFIARSVEEALEGLKNG